MGWLDDAWLDRAVISIDNSAGTGGNFDVDVDIPAEWDAFWDAIDSSGDELRLTGPDGVTPWSYDVDDGSGGAFDKSSRSGRIRIEQIAGAGTACVQTGWLYFDSSSTQGDGSSSFSPSSPKTGHIWLGRPALHREAYQPQNPGSARPRSVIHKSSNETVYAWWRVDHHLAKRFSEARGRILWEEPVRVIASSVDSGGSGASLHDVGSSRLVWHQGQLWVGTEVSGGTDGSSYTIIARVLTGAPDLSGTLQTLEPRTGVRVRDVLAT